MSSPAAFEHLLAVSRMLQDDFIDEDISDVQQGSGSASRTVSNRTITVRGKLRGRALVISYQDLYTTSFSATAPALYEANILEIFAAQPHVSFEGTCRQRNLLDKIGRFFGAGGNKGSHPIFSRMRVDVEEGTGQCLKWVEFPKALEKLALLPVVRRVNLQRGSGLAAIVPWHAAHSSADFVMSIVEEVCRAASTLDAAGRS